MQGLVFYQPQTKFLKARFINKYSRISQFFGDINGNYLLATLKQFEKEVEIIAKRLESADLFTEYKSIFEITNSILPKDDSSLVCSEILEGVDIKAEAAFDDLFDRLINRYNEELSSEQHDDQYAWRKIYKQYFDKYNITPKLKSHSIQTKYDTINFDKAWKNGAWNCYQTLSFDLKKSESIRNKVYKWSGILTELKDAEEDLHLYFLTIGPSKHQKMKQFIEDTLTHQTKKAVTVSLVTEEEAEKFAQQVMQELEE